MKIKFTARPADFYIDITGAIYEQQTPFKTAARDWNNDGDIYPEKVAPFFLIGDENTERDPRTRPPSKLILTAGEFDALKRDRLIIEV